MAKEPIPRTAPNAWSEQDNRLSARLRVEFEDLHPGFRHAVWLELKNVSLHPISVTNRPRVYAELFDGSERFVTPSGVSVGGPMPVGQWAVIPRDCYIGFRLDMQTVGVPTSEHGVVLLAVGGRAWPLMAGDFMLKVAVVFEYDEDGPPNQWVGEFELPPAVVNVGKQMLTPD